ncbi:MAG: DNA polymerase IV [Nitrososphaera sp.]
MSVAPEIAPDASPRRIVMHVDFDYFFAQCEELRRPELKGEPVVVCAYSGRSETSGVVSTSNYLARKYGVKSGIPISTAISRLSSAGVKGAFLPIDRTYYFDISSKAMAILKQSADIFELKGIDECYLDVSSRTKCDYDQAAELASRIKAQVLSELGLTCSIGVAPNKLAAKIASDYRKPEGLTVIRPSDLADFVSQLDVRAIPGIGSRTAAMLAEKMSVRNIADLRRLSSFELVSAFGNKTGAYLFRAARGVEDEAVIGSRAGTSQISHIVTLKRDAESESEMVPYVEEICAFLFQKTAEQDISFRTVTLLLILSNLRNLTRSRMLKTSCSGYEELKINCMNLLRESIKDGLDRKVRRVGVKLSDLHSRSGEKSLLDFAG